MIDIDLDNKTYTCPYCENKQSYSLQEGNVRNTLAGFYSMGSNYFNIKKEDRASFINIYHIKCCNKGCEKVTVVGFLGKPENGELGKQIDILPAFTCKSFPDYIPEQIRDDYKEAVSIIDISPKAAATLLRRCLQGMIRDFWGIKGKTLNAEITDLKD